MSSMSLFSSPGLLVAAGLSLGGAAAPLHAREDIGGGPCSAATTRTVVARPDEPGARLLVRGRLYAPDGERPAAGAILYAYQTDAEGYYSRERGSPPRLRGWMKTDAEGRFEYETIRPGAYPGRTVPAHVHHQAWGGGVPAQWLRELRFADDPLVTTGERERSAAAGRFAWVLAPRREQGVHVVDFNLRLKPAGDDFEPSIRHGREACGLH